MAGGSPGPRRDGEEGVTPVVGTLLILAITVLGITGVMFWGAPTIERIQGQNAQAAMVAEMEDLRQATWALSVPDASRIPTVVVSDGELAIQEGTRILVALGHDPANTGCDLHVTGWADATPEDVVVEAGGCLPPEDDDPEDDCTAIAATESCLEIHEVAGSNTVQEAVDFDGVTATVAGADFTEGDWLFRLTDGDDVDPVVYAEAWLFSGDRFSWTLKTGAGTLGAHMDSGAVFRETDGSLFLEKQPPIQEDAFGSDVYVFWVRSLSSLDDVALSGGGAHQAFLGLVGNYPRADEAEVHRLRLDFQGDLAEAWCQTLLLRNENLSDGAYAEDGPDYACADPTGGEGIRSVTYSKSGGDSFALELLHAAIQVTLSV